MQRLSVVSRRLIEATTSFVGVLRDAVRSGQAEGMPLVWAGGILVPPGSNTVSFEAETTGRIRAWYAALYFPSTVEDQEWIVAPTGWVRSVSIGATKLYATSTPGAGAVTIPFPGQVRINGGSDKGLPFQRDGFLYRWTVPAGSKWHVEYVNTEAAQSLQVGIWVEQYVPKEPVEVDLTVPPGPTQR